MNSEQTPKPKSKPNFSADPKIIAFLAFFPLTGVFGIHDILTKKYWRCILRIVGASLILLSILEELNILYIINIPPDYPQIFVIIFTASPLLFVASYAWAIVEGLQILQMRQGPKNAPDTFETDSSDGMEKKQNQEVSENEKEHAPTISFILSVIIFSFWGSTLFVEPKKLGCTGGIQALWGFGILIMPVYAVLAAVVIKQSISKLKSRSRGLAIASIIMVAISVIFVVRFFIWIPTACNH